MTRAGRPPLSSRCALGFPARLIWTLVAAVALLGTGVAGTGGHSSAVDTERPGYRTAGTLLRTTGNGAVLTLGTGQPTQTPTWSAGGSATAGGQMPTMALLATFLLAVVSAASPSSPSAHALPGRRGPPRLSFIR